jgi:hypothetical protein
MNYTKFKQDGWYVENFLSDTECEAVIQYWDYITNNNLLQWNQISFYGSLAMGYWPEDPILEKFGLSKTFFNEFKIKVKKAAEVLIEKELTEVSYHAQKWVTGAFADYHSDNCDEDGNPTAFERSKYAAFVYLNDDFEGGELKFKNSDIFLKPKKGMLAVFDGGFGNEHMVTTVKSGERYTIGSFWDRADCVYTDEQRKAWDDELKQVRSEQEKLYKKWEIDEKIGDAPKLPEGRDTRGN